VLVTVAVLVIATQLFLTTYQPLDANSTGSYNARPNGLVTQQFEANGTEGDFTQYTVEMRPATEIVVEFPLWNYGPLPIRIDGLDPALYGPGSTAYRLAGIGSMAGPQTGYPTNPFSPFTLAPGEGVQLFLGITPKIGDWAKRSGLVLNTVTLEYRALWVEESATLPIGQSVFICHDCAA
jgi:hypothetical protein